MASKNLEYYLRQSYTVIVSEDEFSDGGKCYRAFCQELPGCSSHGDTPEEAAKSWEEAKELYIETLLDNNQPIPLPIKERTIFTCLMGNVDIATVIPQKVKIRNSFEGKNLQDCILTPTN